MSLMDFLRWKKKAKQDVLSQDVTSMPQQVQSRAVKPSQLPPEVQNSPPQNAAIQESSDDKIPCRKCGKMILKRMAALKAGCCLQCSGSGRSVIAPENVADKELIIAAQNGDVAKVRALLAAGANVNAVNKVGATPLMCAAAVAKTETVRALLAAGAKVHARNSQGYTAMDLAKEAALNPFGELDGALETIKLLAGASAVDLLWRGFHARTT